MGSRELCPCPGGQTISVENAASPFMESSPLRSLRTSLRSVQAGETAIHVSSEYNHPHVVQDLVAAGANVGVPNAVRCISPFSVLGGNLL